MKDNDLTLLAHHGVKKINLGTCLRMVFGNTLRKVISEDPNIFDRIEMFKKCIPAVEEEAANKIKLLNA
ncbi:MAG: class II fructose-bisphosphate aldolase [Lachnospiraceae bacterium]